MFKRKPASGGCTDFARTMVGKKGPGRMGGDRKTIQGLKILKIYPDRNLLLIKGCVPGVRDGVLLIKNSVKR
jgi:large subunit ribosomal protein L3